MVTIESTGGALGVGLVKKCPLVGDILLYDRLVDLTDSSLAYVADPPQCKMFSVVSLTRY